MKTMTWKTKLIIAAIVIALVLAGCGIVSAMSFGSLLLALTSFVGGSRLWMVCKKKNIMIKYFKDK